MSAIRLQAGSTCIKLNYLLLNSDITNEKTEEKAVAADKEEVKVEAVKEDKPSGDAQPI